MVKTIEVKVRHKCRFTDFSKLMGETILFSYFNGIHVIFISTRSLDEQEYTKLKTLFATHSDWENINLPNHNLNYIFSICNCKRSSSETAYITEAIRKSKCIPTQPITYKNGWEYHRFLSLNEESESKAIGNLKKFDDFHLLSINDNLGDILNIQSLFYSEIYSKLTGYQLEILLEAINKGYYEIPRKVKLDEIADHRKITHQAVAKTLRKAENKIMNMLGPHLSLKV